MLTNIRHIILDLGGVILNIDYQRTEQAFRQLGFENFGELYSQLRQSDLFDRLETGRIGAPEFVQSLKKLLPATTTEDQIVAAWNAMLLDLPLRRLQILQQLQLHFDLFLLSNTNTIHENAFNQLVKQQTGFPHMGLFFDKVYYSHRIGLRKPDPAVFTLILEENGLNATHTLFIDDSPQHIKAAAALGIKTIFLKEGMTIEQDIFKAKSA